MVDGMVFASVFWGLARSPILSSYLFGFKGRGTVKNTNLLYFVDSDDVMIDPSLICVLHTSDITMPPTTAGPSRSLDDDLSEKHCAKYGFKVLFSHSFINNHASCQSYPPPSY